MSENSQNRTRLIRKLWKGLVLSTPLTLAAFSISTVANAQSVNCPAGSKLDGGVCMVTSTYQAPSPEVSGEAEAVTSTYSSSYQAQPEAAGEAETGSAYKAQPEATGEAGAGSAYKAQPEATGSSYKASGEAEASAEPEAKACLLYTSPSPRDRG